MNPAIVDVPRDTLQKFVAEAKTSPPRGLRWSSKRGCSAAREFGLGTIAVLCSRGGRGRRCIQWAA